MTSVVRWEEPPPRRPDDRFDWAGIGSDLAKNPGRWALVVICRNQATAASTARHIRNGSYDALRELGNFDAAARTVEGEARVYARYLGEAAS